MAQFIVFVEQGFGGISDSRNFKNVPATDRSRVNLFESAGKSRLVRSLNKDFLKQLSRLDSLQLGDKLDIVTLSGSVLNIHTQLMQVPEVIRSITWHLKG